MLSFSEELMVLASQVSWGFARVAFLLVFAPSMPANKFPTRALLAKRLPSTVPAQLLAAQK